MPAAELLKQVYAGDLARGRDNLGSLLPLRCDAFVTFGFLAATFMCLAGSGCRDRGDDLVTELASGDWQARVNAAREAQRMGSRAASAVPALIRAIGDDDWRVAEAAADALSAIGEPAAPALLAALADGKGHARANAVRALARHGAPVVDRILVLLGDQRPVVRDAAARALAAMETRAIPSLERALASGATPAIRAGAAESLGKIGPPAIGSVDMLGHAVDDIDPGVGQVATEALGRLGPGAVPHLTRALTNRDPWIRALAARYLAALGPAASEAAGALRAAVAADPFDRVRENAGKALAAIAKK